MNGKVALLRARTSESYDELVRAPGFDHRRHATLMDGLTVAATAEAATELWRRTGN